jgi:hypothetical protein
MSVISHHDPSKPATGKRDCMKGGAVAGVLLHPLSFTLLVGGITHFHLFLAWPHTCTSEIWSSYFLS